MHIKFYRNVCILLLDISKLNVTYVVYSVSYGIIYFKQSVSRIGEIRHLNQNT